jgi:GAF domain-containing protein
MEELPKGFPFRCMLSLRPFIEYLKETKAALGTSEAFRVNELLNDLGRVPELLEPIEDTSVLEQHDDIVQRLISLIFSPISWDTDAVAAVVPYTVRPVFVSPRFRRTFLNPDGSFRGRQNVEVKSFNRGRTIRAYLFILEKFYGIQKEFDFPLINIVPDPDTGLDRHFMIRFDFRFVEPRAVNGPRELTDRDRALIMEHLTEPEVLRQVLPPEDFEIHGFTLFRAVDVTEPEIISAMEREFVTLGSIVARDSFQLLQNRLRILFRRPDLVAGLDALKEDQVLQLSSGCEVSHCCIFADTKHIPVSHFEGTVWDRAVKSGEIVSISDLLKESSSTHPEDELLKTGTRSLMAAPLHYRDECIGILHVGSPRPGDFGPRDEMMLEHIRPLFSVAIKKALDDLDIRIQGVIKEKCTAIHPTVEWRFRKAAFNYLEDTRMGRASDIEPIVFKEVYPLFGVSDIRGSTKERNRAIQEDLAEHLGLALKVVQLADEARPMLILRELAGRIEGLLNRIREGLGTGDELSVARFLREEAEPVFPHLRKSGPDVARAIDAYESGVDPHMGTIYGLRREFEESVSTLNDRLASYLDQEEADAQTVSPHYFERHRTDGVDYLIYMGATLLEDGAFSDFYLKNMRLWQIKVACGMAWHTEQLKSSVKTPLDTAHLILVQHTPLAIRFRFDEKRFDVDGAYDIRQEIIKSRIDKAVIKGGDERLTQPGRIAIVYSHQEEALEMRRHINFLQSEGYLTGELEELELEDLPGVQGLRALRIGIHLESSVLAERAGREVG